MISMASASMSSPLVDRRPPLAGDVFVEVLTRAETKEEPARHHVRHGGGGLRHDGRMDSDEGEVTPVPTCSRSVAWAIPPSAAQTNGPLSVDPGVVLVGDQGEGEAGLLGAAGCSDQVARPELPRRKGVTELRDVTAVLAHSRLRSGRPVKVARASAGETTGRDERWFMRRRGRVVPAEKREGVPAAMFTGAKSFLMGTLAGAVAAYFLDPDRGRSRRVKTADMLGARVRRGARELERRSRRVEGAMTGLRHRAEHPGIEHPDVDDWTLKDRVESILFAPGFPKGDVVIDVVDGVVTLRGQLQRHQDIKAAERTVADIPGVVGVRNLLHAPGETPSNVVDAQRASREAERGVDRVRRETG
jgi:HSP20 family molecular chaperone IbpA